MKHVVIVSWHPPESDAVAAQRVKAFLRYFPENGWTTTLVTSTRTLQVDDTARHVIWDPIRSIRTSISSLPSPVRRIISGVLFRCLIPDEQVIWSRWALRQIGSLHADAVLISGPPFSQFPIRHNRSDGALVLDYRDLWTSGTYFRIRGVRAKLSRWWERISTRQAVGALTVSGPLARDLRKSIGLHIAVVMNGFDESEIAPRAILPSGGPLRLIYAGQLYEGRRDPTPLFAALAQGGFGSEEVRLEFYVPAPHQVLDLARQHGVQHLVYASSFVARTQILEEQRSADVLLLLMWDHSGEEGVFTGKLFEYIAARRPILMLGYPKGVAAKLIEEKQLGIVANDPVDIVVSLRTWLESKRSGRLGIPLKIPSDSKLTRREQVRIAAKYLDRVTGHGDD